MVQLSTPYTRPWAPQCTASRTDRHMTVWCCYWVTAQQAKIKGNFSWSAYSACLNWLFKQKVSILKWLKSQKITSSNCHWLQTCAVLTVQEVIICSILLVFLFISFIISAVSAWMDAAITVVCVSHFLCDIKLISLIFSNNSVNFFPSSMWKSTWQVSTKPWLYFKLLNIIL